jgi:hypothetical protein
MKCRMLTTVKIPPMIRFTLRFTTSFRVTDRNAITNGTHQKSDMKNNISGPIAIASPSSIAPGPIKDNALWAERATAMKTHNTEILTLRKIKSSRDHHLLFFS